MSIKITDHSGKGNLILSYTYLLKFIIDERPHYYYGARCRNVALNLSPLDDIFKKYFSSSKVVKNFLKENILPDEVIIHKTFENKSEAFKYEVFFLNSIDASNRKDFFNQTNYRNVKFPNNSGRKKTPLQRKWMGEYSKEAQSKKEYKEWRREQALNRWKDPVFIAMMKKKNNIFWNSEKGKRKKELFKLAFKGKSHTEETKKQMSESAKKACSKIDCSARSFKRKRYNCPICGMKNLDGGNFNNHVKLKHNWDNQTCITYKKNY